MMKIFLFTLLSLTVLSLPVWAGLFPTEISLSTKQPRCLTVYAGGVTGPGSGVTIENTCSMPITLSTIQGTVSNPDVYLHNIGPSGTKTPHDFSKNSSLGYAVLFKFASTGHACDHDTTSTNNSHDALTVCSSIIIAPGEAVLIFSGAGSFIYTGSPDMTIKGKSFFLPQKHDSAETKINFGSMK